MSLKIAERGGLPQDPAQKEVECASNQTFTPASQSVDVTFSSDTAKRSYAKNQDTLHMQKGTHNFLSGNSWIGVVLIQLQKRENQCA